MTVFMKRFLSCLAGGVLALGLLACNGGGGGSGGDGGGTGGGGDGGGSVDGSYPPPLASVSQLSLLAGNIGGPAFVDGQGSEARFSGLTDTAVDAAGNIYVADAGNHVIRKVSPAGLVSLYAGKAGEAGSADGALDVARFKSPGGLAMSPAGDLIVADSDNHTIRRISPEGQVSTVAGLAGVSAGVDGQGPDARFATPAGVAVDAGGHIYVADSANNAIRKISPSGQVTTLAGALGQYGIVDGQGAQARFASPRGVAVNAGGWVFVTDAESPAIRQISPYGQVGIYAGHYQQYGSQDGILESARFMRPSGIMVAANGDVYVTDTYLIHPFLEHNLGSSNLRRISNGFVSTVAGLAGQPGSADGQGNAARFFGPAGVAQGANGGDLYVADMGNNTLRRVTLSGNVTTVAGLARQVGYQEGTGAAVLFSDITDVVLDAAGNAYVSDSANHVIRKITPAGVTSLLAGTPGEAGHQDGAGAQARFRQPQGLALDKQGNLYVADSENHVIRQISASGVVSTVAGKPGEYGYADGAVSDARFTSPMDVVVDSSGSLLVADRNHVIRKIQAGQVTLFAGKAGEGGWIDGQGGDARFYSPVGLAVDAQDNLYVTDITFHTIRKVSPSGLVTTLAGQPGVSGFADGVGSAALFNQPYGLTLDSAGNVYVADSVNNAIRRITPNGTVSTLLSRPDPGSSMYGPVSSAFTILRGVALNAQGLYVAASGAVLLAKP